MKAITLLTIFALLTGCASTYTPVIDTYQIADMQRYRMDLQECKDIATVASGSTVTGAAYRGIALGLLGAATGAAIGAVLGIPGTGAALGAAVLGPAGLASGTSSTIARHNGIFRNCMIQRGYRLLD